VLVREVLREVLGAKGRVKSGVFVREVLREVLGAKGRNERRAGKLYSE
jgi:hypothetical protein